MALTINGTAATIVTDQTTLSTIVNTSTTAENYDSSGRMIAPTRPQAKKNNSSDVAAGNTWAPLSDTAPGSGTYSGQSSWINTSNGRFTAPIAGVYAFASHAIPTSATGDARIAWYINGNQVARSIFLSYGGSHAGQGGFPITLQLAAGDYVYFSMYSGATTHGGNWSGISGCLVG